MKKDLEDLEKNVGFLGVADCRSVPHGTEILQIGTNRTNR